MDEPGHRRIGRQRHGEWTEPLTKLLWDHESLGGKDCGTTPTVGALVNALAPYVKAGDKDGFAEEINRLFLGGAWGHAFHVMSEAHVQQRTFANDIRGLVWDCLKRRI